MQLTLGHDFDYILAGGGLQAGLLVLALRHYRPTASVLVVERGHAFGGNHTWSFHRGDIPAAAQTWIRHLPTHNWEAYHVRFPKYERLVELEYATTTSRAFAEVIHQHLPADERHASRLLLNREVANVSSKAITTACGERFTAGCVIDCRGQQPTSSVSARPGRRSLDCGYQKFFGVEIELNGDWPFTVPMLMDACVDQADGFHFVYTLPFEKRRILIEDTWFSNSPRVDFDQSGKHLRKYIEKQTQASWNAIRFERGCLPMPRQGMNPLPASPVGDSAALAGGYAGGWFHAATGYSFPLAVKFAQAVATVAPEDAASAIEKLRLEHQYRFRFSRLLNRLLFDLVQPDSRWQIFRRLYRSLPPTTLARFYAHEFSAADAARMVIGMPPRGLSPLKFLRGMRNTRAIPRSHALETSP